MNRAWKRPNVAAVASFGTNDLASLHRSYVRDPSNVRCPRCGVDWIEVLSFTTEPGDDGTARETSYPEGHYVVQVFCWKCRRKGGFHVDEEDDIGPPWKPEK